MIMRGLVWCASAEGLIPKSYPSSGANKHSTWVALGGTLFDGGVQTKAYPSQRLAAYGLNTTRNVNDGQICGRL
jgi:hypothetical protein